MSKNRRYTARISSMGTSRNYCIGVTDNDTNDLLVNIYEVLKVMNGLDGTVKDLSDDYEQLLKENKELKQENKEFKALLNEMSDCNNEIWLDDGRIYRLKKIFVGKWKWR